MEKTTASHDADLEAVRRVFGVSPDEVLCPARRAIEALDWIEALLRSIKVAAGNDTPVKISIKSLADMGGYIAFDTVNFCDVELEKLEEALSQAKGGAA